MNIQRWIFQWILGQNLHQAAAAGDLARVRALLVADPAAINTPDEQGMTPLQYAAANGHLQVVEVLLSNDADVGAATPDGRTALHLTAHNGHQLLAKFLLAKGANPLVTDARGNTPLMLAQQRRKVGVAEILQQHQTVD